MGFSPLFYVPAVVVGCIMEMDTTMAGITIIPITITKVIMIMTSTMKSITKGVESIMGAIQVQKAAEGAVAITIK